MGLESVVEVAGDNWSTEGLAPGLRPVVGTGTCPPDLGLVAEPHQPPGIACLALLVEDIRSVTESTVRSNILLENHVVKMFRAPQKN